MGVRRDAQEQVVFQIRKNLTDIIHNDYKRSNMDCAYYHGEMVGLKVSDEYDNHSMMFAKQYGDWVVDMKGFKMYESLNLEDVAMMQGILSLLRAYTEQVKLLREMSEDDD